MRTKGIELEFSHQTDVSDLQIVKPGELIPAFPPRQPDHDRASGTGLEALVNTMQPQDCSQPGAFNGSQAAKDDTRVSFSLSVFLPLLFLPLPHFPFFSFFSLMVANM